MFVIYFLTWRNQIIYRFKIQAVGISLVVGATTFSSAGARYSVNSLVAFCCTEKLSRTWEPDCNIFFIFISGLARGFFAESIGMTGINAPGLFCSWLENCSLCPSPHQFIRNDSCSWSNPVHLPWFVNGMQLRTGSAGGRLLWVKSDIPDFFHHTFIYLLAFTDLGHEDSQSSKLASSQGCLSLKASYLRSWGVLVSVPELKTSL